MRIKDVFESQSAYQTGHDPGLVVVLDALITRNPDWLAGCIAYVQSRSGEELRLTIDEAKEHGPANSLFFRGLTRDQIEPGGEITVTVPIDRHTQKKQAS